MITLDWGLVGSVAAGAGIGGAVVLYVAGIHGVSTDPGAPPTRGHRARAALASPALRGRAGGAIAAAILTLIVTRWPVAAAAIGVLVLAWPYLFGGAGAERAAIARLDALVIWTESLRDTVAAHVSLEQAIPASTTSAPAVIAEPLARLAGQIRARTPLDAALLELAADLDDAGADLVIAALVLNVRRRGDRLAQVLSGLATTAREELDLRRRISAGRAGLRRGVQIIVLMTLLIAGYLSAFAGPYLAPYDSVAGQVALLVVVAIFTAGFVWLRRLAAGSVSAPFLARPGHQSDPREQRVVEAVSRLAPVPGRWTR